MIQKSYYVYEFKENEILKLNNDCEQGSFKGIYTHLRGLVQASLLSDVNAREESWSREKPTWKVSIMNEMSSSLKSVLISFWWRRLLMFRAEVRNIWKLANLGAGWKRLECIPIRRQDISLVFYLESKTQSQGLCHYRRS